jgi:hypothetical protein
VQDLAQTVLPITELKLLGLTAEAKFGTGFCLDPACRFVATNYHVAMIAAPRKIRGDKVLQRFIATGPDDDGATLNDGPAIAPLKFNLSRDLAIFELRHPLAHHHGIRFCLDELQPRQQVDIYAYPKEAINPFRRLHQFHGAFRGETTAGLLAFDYIISDGEQILPGASGGLVVDHKTQQIVGILNGIAKVREPIALAVSIQSLADFVAKVDPYLAHTLFPMNQKISPVSADLYPKFVPPPAEAVQHREDESIEIQVLRSKAQLLADNMHDFIAVQTLEWGMGDKLPMAESAYEVRVLDGFQRFREFPNGHKELQNVPFPSLNTAMVPGAEWSELPQMVGTELRLKIHQAADVVVNEKRMKVFQYWANGEDGVCRWKSIFDFGLFSLNKVFIVSCYGEVWTDMNTNILRMSEHYELPGKWHEYQAVVTYGWLQRADDAPRLIPLTIASQAVYNKKLYWCRGRFTGYQMFTSQAKIAAN